jgi:hypothetical protein
LVAFADDRRLLRLRHPVQNDDAVACDACGSVEPRWLHLLKDEASGRYALVGSNCLRALTVLRVVRRRYAVDSADQAYAEELTHRLAERTTTADVRTPMPGEHDVSGAVPGHVAVEECDRLVAAVAVLTYDEWASLLRMLPFGAARWRFIATDGAAEGLDGLVVIGVHGSVSTAGPALAVGDIAAAL